MKNIKRWIAKRLEIETVIADSCIKAIIVEFKERLRRWAS
jgi:hypothetical protein